MKQQVIVIHGGETFDTYEDYLTWLKNREPDDLSSLKQRRWKDSLQETLGNEFDVVRMRMPCSFNANYNEWKIWFEKYISLFDDNVIFVGHSLGGIFLVKYLAENEYPKQIKALLLVAAPFDDSNSEYSLATFKLPDDITHVSSQVEHIMIFHSTDDPVVSFEDAKQYQALLKGELISFSDRAHFSTETFPELTEIIRGL